MMKTVASKPAVTLVNAFIGRGAAPTSAEVKTVLGSAFPVWKRLLKEVSAECGTDGQEWSSYSVKAGWSLRLKRGERNIVYLVPCRECFWVSFALGEKAMQAARKANLPEKVLGVMATAKKYAEGSAVRFPVSAEDVEAVKALVIAKINN